VIRKPTYLKLHRWLGLTVGLFLMIQGLTGAVMAFRDALEPVVVPSLIVPERPARLPVQALLDAFHRAHPDADLTRAEFPDAANQAVIFKSTIKKVRWLTAVDPFDGRVVHDGTMTAWPLEFIFNIHEQLLSGPIGETLIGIEGLSLLFLAIMGIGYWWPGRKRLKQGFRVKLDGSADLRWRTLHRAVGGGVAVILLMSATTGVLMVWKEQVRGAMNVVAKTESRPSPKVAKSDGAAMVPIDPLIARAKAVYGDTPFRQLRFSSGGRVVAVFLDSNRTIRADGTNQVYFNRYDGRELAHYIAGTQSGGAEFLDWVYTVHTGLWGGAVTQAIMLVTGLTLFGMALSGLWLWFTRTRTRRERARKAARANDQREKVAMKVVGQ
jgi:uncharacterized iron-regulated membrane protein